MVFYVGR